MARELSMNGNTKLKTIMQEFNDRFPHLILFLHASSERTQSTKKILDVEKTHVLPLGYGLIYSISESPNLVREFDTSSKLCTFRTVQYVQEGAELSYFS